MTTTALGVPPDDDNNGLDPLTYRQLIRRHWVNTGVVSGLTVTGGTDLRYHVAAGMAICSMGDADGYTEAYWPGGTTESVVSAGDTTYSRIDTVYILANTGIEITKPDGTKVKDNLIHVDVVQGTPSASPVKPQLPSGAIPIMSMLMPAGGSTTGAASQYDGDMTYALPAAGQLGKIGEKWDTTQEFTGSNQKQYVWHDFPIKFTLATDRQLEFVFDVCFSVTGGSSIEWACGFELNPSSTAGDSDSCIEGSCANFVSGTSWETHSNHFTTNVNAGTYTAYVASWLQNPAGVAPVFHYGKNASGHGTFVGRRFQIFDRGPAQ